MCETWKSFRALYSFNSNLTETPCTGKLKGCERNLNHAVFPTKGWVSWKARFQVSCFLAASLWILILCSGQSWRAQRSDAGMGLDHNKDSGHVVALTPPQQTRKRHQVQQRPKTQWLHLKLSFLLHRGPL